jgi:hypothetical protein
MAWTSAIVPEVEMLQELIQRWRGIDHWPEVDCTVVFNEVVAEEPYEEGPPFNRITFNYRDPSGAIQSGVLVADSLTSLYNLRVNDTFQVRVNPKRPSLFYTGEAKSLFTEVRLVSWVCAGVLLLIALFIALRSLR